MNSDNNENNEIVSDGGYIDSPMSGAIPDNGGFSPAAADSVSDSASGEENG